MFISLARRKGTKETSTLTKAFPYMGRMQLTSGRNRPTSRFWYDSQSFRPSGESWFFNRLRVES